MELETTEMIGIETVTASVVTTTAALDALREEWDALFEVSPSAAPPLRWRWVREWWRVYGPVYGDGGRGLRIVVVRRGPRLIGVLPVYEGVRSIGPVSMRALTFISAGAAEFEETSIDYLGLLYAPGEEETCAKEIASILRDSRRFRWDVLQFPTMSHRTPLRSLAQALSSWACRGSLVQRHHCFVFDATGGLEAYLERLSTKVRTNARRLLRQASGKGMAFEIATSREQAERLFSTMVELHRKRWQARGKPGSFAPRHAEFHRSMLLGGVDSGEVRIGQLSFEGAPLALVYGHRAGETFYTYQQGVDTTTKSSVHSPGTAVYLLIMKHLSEQGVRVFDLQKGENTFKKEYSTSVHELVHLDMRRLSARCLGYTCADLSVRAARRLGRDLRSLNGGDRVRVPAISGATAE